MDFQKYNSLENHYRGAFINKIEYEGKSSGMWIAHEKIHGSNLSFWYNGTDIKVAKRSGFLGEFERFNNFQEVLEKYKDSIISTYESMCSKSFITEGDTLIIFGEIFGGHLEGYESKPHTIHVQGGVQYCPDVDFLYFDIKVIRTNGDSFNEWLSPSQWPYYVVGNLKTAPIAHIEGFEDIFNACNEFESLVPAYLGFDKPSIGNICEGIVIRPFNIVSFSERGERFIIKSKNQKWSEKDLSKRKTERTSVLLSEDDDVLVNKINSYIVINRLRNVLSKESNLTQKDFNKVSGKLLQDALEEFDKDCVYPGESFEAYVGDRKGIVKKALQELCNKLVGQYWGSIIKGDVI